MKDHREGCEVVTRDQCTCSTEYEVQALYWEAKHHRQKVISFFLGFWFALAALFNILFTLDIWL